MIMCVLNVEGRGVGGCGWLGLGIGREGAGKVRGGRYGFMGKKAWKVRGCGRGLSSWKFRVYAGVESAWKVGGYVGVESAWKVRGGVNKRKAG